MALRSRPICVASPYCEPLVEIAPRLGVSPALPWRWVHLGPLEVGLTLLTEHRASGPSDVRQVATGPEWGAYGGMFVDLLGLSSPPRGIQASYHGLAGLWWVYAVAHRGPTEPSVSMWASGDGSVTQRVRLPSPPTTSLYEDRFVKRCIALLQGRLGRRAPRPARIVNSLARIDAIVSQAEAIRARSPAVPWSVIAGRLGVAERSLRRYRNDPTLKPPAVLAMTRRFA